jgi:hypothetical protein
MSDENDYNDKLLKHVIYEIQRLYYIYSLKVKNIYINSDNPNDVKGISDAIYTSFLLHFRNLYYFFNDKERKEDIKISTFVTEKEEVLNYKFDFDIDHINKCLSHLTKGRLDYENSEEFNFNDMFLISINKCLQLFDYITTYNLTKYYMQEILDLKNEFTQMVNS